MRHLVFDIETIPDMAGWRRLSPGPADVTDAQLHAQWRADRAAENPDAESGIAPAPAPERTVSRCDPTWRHPCRHVRARTSSGAAVGYLPPIEQRIPWRGQ